MSKSTDRQERFSNAIIGLVVIIIGIFITYILFNSTPRGTGGSILDWLIFIGPMLFLMGIVMLVRGLVWEAPAFSGRTVLYTGLLMLLVGGFPWLIFHFLLEAVGEKALEYLGHFFSSSLVSQD